MSTPLFAEPFANTIAEYLRTLEDMLSRCNMSAENIKVTEEALVCFLFTKAVYFDLE